MTAPLLEVRDLSVTLARGGDELPVLDKVSFDIAPGEMLALIGANGAEKVVEFDLNDAESAMFAKSVTAVQGLVDACKEIDPSLK